MSVLSSLIGKKVAEVTMRPLFPAKFPKNDNKPGEPLLAKQKKY